MTQLETLIEDEKKEIDGEKVKDFLATAMQRVYTESRKDFLRSEIEKLEGIEDGGMHLVGCPISHIHLEVSSCECGIYNRGYNQALTSIITRYKEELLELDGKEV